MINRLGTDPVVTTRTARQIPGIIKACVENDRSFFLIGKPGIGKTQIVGQTLERMGLSMIDVRGATMDSVDARGVPFVTDGQTHWARPDMWPTEGAGCIFFDEFNRSQTQVMNALMNVIHDKCVAGHRIPSTWATGAAGNDIDVGVQKMGEALRDRFTFVNVVVDNDDWTKWAIQSGKIEPVVVAFLHFAPELLSTYDKKALVNATPRSWEVASKFISHHYDAETQHGLLAGTVGEEAAVKFASFEPVYATMPSIDAILADPAGAVVPPADQPNLRVAIASALAYRATDQNITQVITYLDRLPGEFAAFAMTDARSKSPEIAHTRQYVDWAAAHNIAA